MDYISAKAYCENSAIGASLAQISNADEFSEIEEYVIEFSNQHDSDPANDNIGTDNLGNLWLDNKHQEDVSIREYF